MGIVRIFGPKYFEISSGRLINAQHFLEHLREDNYNSHGEDKPQPLI